jgi:hypothetical protein
VEFILLLGTPIAGAIFLGFFGDRRWAPEANAAFSLATFLAGCALAARIVGEGSFSSMRSMYFW